MQLKMIFTGDLNQKGLLTIIEIKMSFKAYRKNKGIPYVRTKQGKKQRWELELEFD